MTPQQIVQAGLQHNKAQPDDHVVKSALYALQCVKAQCGDEIAHLIVPGDSRTLDTIVDQAIEGLTPAKPPQPQFLELGGNEIDLRRVVSIGPTGGDPEWLRYTAFFYGDGSHHIEIYERRCHSDGHPLPQMPREEFIKLWKAANQ